MVNMRYPVTLGAKIVQFPFRYYYENTWVFRYWMYGVGASVPLFWWIQTKSRSEGNWKAYYAAKEKERLEHAEHH